MTISWVLPTKRTDGEAAPATEVRESEVALSADNGSTWSVLGTVATGSEQRYERDLAAGAYKVRVTVIDSDGQRGVPSISDAKVSKAQLAAPTVTVRVE